MMKVVAIRECFQHYHDGDSVFMGYNVVRWDGEREEIDSTTYGPNTKSEDLPAVDPEASAAWRAKRLAAEAEYRRIENEARQTEIVLNDLYRIRRGQTVRTIKGRKLAVGTVTVCLSNPVQSSFNRYQSNISTEKGWIDTDNLECVVKPESLPGEMRCPGCREMRCGADYVFSGWEAFGRANRGVEWCKWCAAARYTNSEHGSTVQLIALSVLDGDLGAIYPLVDALQETGNEYDYQRAEELKQRHKIGIVARKPRKKKESAVTV